MPAAHAFNGNAALSLRLPRCPAPRCASCAAELRDVRPFRTEQPTAGTVLVECLAKCGRCSTKHRGTRRLQRTPQGIRFLNQSFALWTESDSQALRPVADALASAGTNQPTTTTARAPVQIEAVKAGARAAAALSSSHRRRRLIWLGAALTTASAALGSIAYALLA